MKTTSQGAEAALPRIHFDRHGQAKVLVSSEPTADAQCEALQAPGAWPVGVADAVYFVRGDGSVYMTCGRP